MKKKTALAMALLPNPKVLFLDEPFEGIDPVTSAELRGLLENAAKRGITIFLTSHILSIVDRLADHIVMIKAGRIVWDAPVRQLPQEIEAHYFELVESPESEDLSWLGQG
jgi:ABC-2 type transport system ATP-binding protein